MRKFRDAPPHFWNHFRHLVQNDKPKLLAVRESLTKSDRNVRFCKRLCAFWVRRAIAFVDTDYYHHYYHFKYICASIRDRHLKGFNTLRPRWPQFSKRHFKMNFLEWKFIRISLKLVPMSPFNNIPALIQIIAWRQTLSDQWWLVYWRIYASLGRNELMAVEYQGQTINI